MWVLVSLGLVTVWLEHSSETGLAMLTFFSMAIGVILVREAVITYPKTAATKRASSVLRASTEGVNMMIMSLRHEASLPKAMRVAAGVDSEFGKELRYCIWSVMMGIHSSFEDALQAVAARWGDHSRELKSSFHALITASCEGSESGRRSALDRASRSLVSGARRRIEDYALGLALPSMMLFSIGVLLPLMVGSFLPMMSWDMWTDAHEPFEPTPTSLPVGTIVRTVLVMNVVFPAVALLIAVDAVSRHPVTPECRRAAGPRHGAMAMAGVVAVASAGFLASEELLSGTERWVGLTLSGVVPVALLLIASGSGEVSQRVGGSRVGMEDLLFSIGARLAEGENLESAVGRTVARGGRTARLTLLDGGEALLDSVSDASRTLPSVVEASRVVARAAATDEFQAGILAMDLSRYIRDLSDLELTLRRRLRPTISMMRLTSHVLAPIMLGITYAIYLSLASIGGGDFLDPGVFFVVLGVFLAEMNSVVAYFVWGIGEVRADSELARSAGSSVLTAILIFAATVLVAC
jgi:hypothetical protein